LKNYKRKKSSVKMDAVKGIQWNKPVGRQAWIALGVIFLINLITLFIRWSDEMMGVSFFLILVWFFRPRSNKKFLSWFFFILAQVGFAVFYVQMIRPWNRQYLLLHPTVSPKIIYGLSTIVWLVLCGVINQMLGAMLANFAPNKKRFKS
jgi:hypothetical protein